MPAGSGQAAHRRDGLTWSYHLPNVSNDSTCDVLLRAGWWTHLPLDKVASFNGARLVVTSRPISEVHPESFPIHPHIYIYTLREGD